MALKSVVTVEIKKNDRVYTFTMEVGSPFGEAYDACFEVLQELIVLSKKAADSAARSLEQST